jgi:hypothetical protein
MSPNEPISVPVDEPTEEQKAKLEEDNQKNELITQVQTELRNELEGIQNQLLSVNEDSTQNELVVVSNALADLGAKADAGAAKLTAAGIGSDVYSLRGIQEGGDHAKAAAGDAGSAAAADTSEMKRDHLQRMHDQLRSVSVGFKG